MAACSGVFTATQSTTTRRALRRLRPAGRGARRAVPDREPDLGIAPPGRGPRGPGRENARQAAGTREHPGTARDVGVRQDVYLRAAALRSLIDIEGAASLRPWLERLSRDAPIAVREVARRALEDTAGEQ